MRFFLTIFTIVISISLYSQDFSRAEKILNSRNELYISFQLDNTRSIENLNKIMSIDKVKNIEDKNEIIAYLNKEQFSLFKERNIDFEILSPPSYRYMKSTLMCSDINSLSTWDCYPTHEQYVELMQKYVTDYPNLCKLVEFGKSVQGRKLLVLKISDNVNIKEEEPEVFYTSTMHGDETTGYILMLRLIDYLLSNYNTDNRIKELLDNTEIWINPLANPDGTYFSGNHTVNGATRSNSNGSDLNRNFPSIQGNTAKSSDMQVETEVMIDFMKQHNFSLAANFHGGEEVVNYPWDTWYAPHVHADNDWYVKISREYADTVHANSKSGYLTYGDNGIIYGADWYRIDNSRQDYLNYYLHGREITIELSNTKCPSASSLPKYWEYNYRSLINYIENVHKGIQGKVTNESGEQLRAKITILGHDKDSSEIYSDKQTGWYYRMLNGGNYDFKVTCDGYQDVYFNETVEENTRKRVDVVLRKIETEVASIFDDEKYSLQFNNPVRNFLDIEIFCKEYSTMKFSVYNISGKKVMERSIDVKKDMNFIKFNFAGIKKGFYICELSISNYSRKFKILKL